MAKIKYTKNELKAQRDSLKRFQRFLPTLQLKKQQLQMEIRRVDQLIEEKANENKDVRARLSSWIQLFAEPIDLAPYAEVDQLITSMGNIAGVPIPVLDQITFKEKTQDLFDTNPWVDQGIAVLRELTKLKVELQILEEQQRRLRNELRTTTQRVNLFEKVKIPEAKDNIRVIRIFMGDQQTAAVARSKIAKGKSA